MYIRLWCWDWIANDKSNSAVLVFNSQFAVGSFIFFLARQSQPTSKTHIDSHNRHVLWWYLVPLYVNFSAFTIFFPSISLVMPFSMLVYPWRVIFFYFFIFSCVSFFLWLLPASYVCCFDECFQAIIIIIIMGFVTVLFDAVTVFVVVVAKHVSLFRQWTRKKNHI